jgi:DDE superfamily endonuclease
VIPPQANAECVCAMEDVLAVYTRPDDSRRPQVCVEETSTPLVAETRLPIPAAPGQPERVDDEYARQGTATLFMVFEPWAGQRRVKVTERRTAVDFAHLIREVVDEQYPQAEKIVLVMDHLNTHKPASLYEAFPPAEARRRLERLEIHHTPKHGSWLDMAETELSVLARPCLDRRIPDATTLTQEIAAWERHRNAAKCRVEWRFTTEDARIQLKRLYPSIQLC